VPRAVADGVISVAGDVVGALLSAGVVALMFAVPAVLIGLLAWMIALLLR
jgi:hypothetical protein